MHGLLHYTPGALQPTRATKGGWQAAWLNSIRGRRVPLLESPLGAAGPVRAVPSVGRDPKQVQRPTQQQNGLARGIGQSALAPACWQVLRLRPRGRPGAACWVDAGRQALAGALP